MYQDGYMTRRADPECLHLARRLAIRNRLISGGKDPDLAERWCDAWEAEAALRDLRRDGDLVVGSNPTRLARVWRCRRWSDGTMADACAFIAACRRSAVRRSGCAHG